MQAYGNDSGGADTPCLPISGCVAAFTLIRSGATSNAYASTAGPYQHLLTLQGAAVAGAIGKNGQMAFGVSDVNEAETAILSNFYVINSASEDLSGVTGGTFNPTAPARLGLYALPLVDQTTRAFGEG